MTMTSLDPKTALIVIDLQKGITALPAAHPMDDVLHHAARLADAFRQEALPVVLVTVHGTPPGRTEQTSGGGERPDGWTDLVPELNRQPTDHLVTKRTWGAFSGTGLADYLKGAAVTQVVIAGVATSMGVGSTARQAHELGFNVTLAIDAMTDMSAQAHDNSVTHIFPRLGETAVTQDIMAHLGGDGRSRPTS